MTFHMPPTQVWGPPDREHVLDCPAHEDNWEYHDRLPTEDECECDRLEREIRDVQEELGIYRR